MPCPPLVYVLERSHSEPLSRRLEPARHVGTVTAKRGVTSRRVSPPTAAPFVPSSTDLERLREAAAGCRGCHLWRVGTQTVFGEGPPRAPLMLVGEQPGDQEDREGEPFVGPAGKLLDGALDEAGIARTDVYVTNAVKHFKWERGEKSARRIHKKPNDEEVRACYPWLASEIVAVRPRLIVALGATAAQALLGKSFRVTRERGRVVHTATGQPVLATVHPSAVLRAPTPEARAQGERDLVKDLRAAVTWIRKG